MTPHEFLVFMVGMGLVVWACGFALGRWVWPSYRRAVALTERELDAAYDEGYDDGLHDRPLDLPSPDAHGEWTTGSSGARADRAGELHDWRQDYAEQLAPAVLDAENLPGQPAPAPLAGEHHLEAPLPAVLHLGAEYDGGDQTFARVALRQMTAINAHERARKALCEECGVPWLPMEAIAA